MAMASNRKKGDYSVLSEINTEEEWNTLMERKGLVVVDVYSEWSGPCSAMTNFLKKIKLEVNDDLLHYAMAKTDTIPQLEIFRGQCKPTWLFISGGEPVAVMHGANAPLLQKMIEREIRKERQVLKGEAVRDVISLEDAVPAKSKSKAATNLWADTDEEDNADSIGSDKAAAADEGTGQQKNFTVLAIEPHIYENTDLLLLLKSIFVQEEFEIIQERDVSLTLDDIRFLTSGVKITEDNMDLIVTKMLEMQAKIMMLRTDESVKAGQRLNAMLGPLFPVEGEGKKTIKCKMTAKSAISSDPEGDILFSDGLRTFYDCHCPSSETFPGFLCPDYAGFIGITEKHFYETLTSVLDDSNVECRKALLVFPEDTKEFVQTELEDAKFKILGTCSTKLNTQKAQLLIGKSRNKSKLGDAEKHGFLMELSRMEAFAVIIRRETAKEARGEQNAAIEGLDPLIFTLHLGSMKIFFTNIETEEKTVDGEVLGELDQGFSSDEEDPPKA